MTTFSHQASNTKPTASIRHNIKNSLQTHLFVLDKPFVNPWRCIRMIRKTGLGEMHVHAYLSYNDACLILNMLACHALHLCVTLGKKARLHLIFFLLAYATSIPIRCFFLKEHLTPIGIKAVFIFPLTSPST
jgi:hypothetical protein